MVLSKVTLDDRDTIEMVSSVGWSWKILYLMLKELEQEGKCVSSFD